MFTLTDQEKKVAVFLLVVIAVGSLLRLAFRLCPSLSHAVAVVDNAAFYTRMNVNTATRAELETVPLIGPSRAQMIVAARASGGKFRDSADLARAGIGPGVLSRIGKYLVFR